jgi:hypothetical protein
VGGVVFFPSYDGLGAVELFGMPRLRDASRSRHGHAESAVPRYFIDTNDDDLFVADDEGLDLFDAHAARKAALAALPDMAQEKMPDGDDRIFCASVRDEAGEVIYEATLTLRGEWRADKPAS